MINIREELFKLKDDKYKDFSSKLTRTKYPNIGVRIPLIKKLAKDISESNCLECFYSGNPYFEEIMLEGLTIGYLKDIKEVLVKLEAFVSKIDDWSVCDSTCSNLKITNKYKDIVWDFITRYKHSDKEFEVRFMIVMMMDYFLETKYTSKIFNIIDNIKCDKYYVKMAVAWLLATSIVKCEKETIEYISNCKLDDFTFNKMISKCCDSYRVSCELKCILRAMRK